MDKLVLEVNNYLVINKAKVEINKINVVGGVNGSGKSTLSKILYSFLKGNSTKRRDYALQSILDDINEIIDELNYEGNDYNLPSHLSIKDNDSYIMKKYNELIKIDKKHRELAKIRVAQINSEMDEIINNVIRMFEKDYCSRDELTVIYESKKKEFDSQHEYSDAIKDIIEKQEDIWAWRLALNGVIRTIELYEFKSRGIYGSNELLSDQVKELSNELYKLDDLESQWDYFSKFIYSSRFPLDFDVINIDLDRKIDRFFGEDSPDISRDAVEGMFSNEYVRSNHDLIYIGLYSQDKFGFYVNANGSKKDAYDYFFNNFIDSIYYIDTVSIIDSWSVTEDLTNLFHIENLLKDLFGRNNDLNINQDVINILEKIEIMTKVKLDNFRRRAFKINDKYIFRKHISSGIKQIRILQLLLGNNKLKRDGYLIIDEPEVNLHPEWQFKFAEILVMLARDLNITIYLNSHSPFFIEAIDAFTEFYDMQDDINYYLTEESENEGKYNFTKIESDELYKIYDSLGRPYDLIDQLRLQKHLGE